MGCSTPPTPAGITTEDELVKYNPPSTELIGKVGGSNVYEKASLMALIAAICFPTSPHGRLRLRQDEHRMFLPQGFRHAQAKYIRPRNTSRQHCHLSVDGGLHTHGYIRLWLAFRSKLGFAGSPTCLLQPDWFHKRGGSRWVGLGSRRRTSCPAAPSRKLQARRRLKGSSKSWPDLASPHDQCEEISRDGHIHVGPFVSSLERD